MTWIGDASTLHRVIQRLLLVVGFGLAALLLGKFAIDFLAQDLLLGALNWAPEWYRPGAAQSAEEVAAEATRMICDGLGLRS